MWSSMQAPSALSHGDGALGTGAEEVEMATLGS
jgi:hypothetical protein